MDLAPSDTVKSLSSALLVFILSKQELKLKFQDKKDHWFAAKISIYIWLVQKFLCILILLVHISGNLPTRASELETAKHQNLWLTHQRNLFLDPENGLFVFETYLL